MKIWSKLSFSVYEEVFILSIPKMDLKATHLAWKPHIQGVGELTKITYQRWM